MIDNNNCIIIMLKFIYFFIVSYYRGVLISEIRKQGSNEIDEISLIFELSDHIFVFCGL